MKKLFALLCLISCMVRAETTPPSAPIPGGPAYFDLNGTLLFPNGVGLNCDTPNILNVTNQGDNGGQGILKLKKFILTTGPDQCAGKRTLNGTTPITINTTQVTTNSLVFISPTNACAQPGNIIQTINPGVSVLVQSDQPNDTRNFNWFILDTGAPQISATISATNLIAYYDMIEGSGTIIHDRSGNGNDLTMGDVLGLQGNINGNPSWIPTGLNFNGSQCASRAWNQNLGAYTAYIVFQVTAQNAPGAWSLLGGGRQDGVVANQWALTADYTNGYPASWNLNGSTYFNGIRSYMDGNWHLMTWAYAGSGSTVDIYVDGSLVLTTTVPLAQFTTTHLYLGAYQANGYLGNIASVAMYNTYHPQSVVTAQYNTFNLLMQARGINLGSSPYVYVFKGDSETNSPIVNINQMLPNQTMANLNISEPYKCYNLGSQGQALANMDAVAGDSLVSLGTSHQIYVIWGGSNDIQFNNTPSITLYNNLVTFCKNRKAANPNVKIAVLTILPWATEDSNKEALRQGFNSLVETNWSTFADALIDVGSGTGPFAILSNPNNKTIYADGTHLTYLGIQPIATQLANAISGW